MSLPPLHTLSLAGASDLIHRGELSPVDLVEACLVRIETLNPALNAFLHVAADHAREQAEGAAAALERGEDWGPLHGIPIGVKDLIDVAGMPTTAGSLFMRDHIASHNAPVITHLEAAGAIVIGKTHLHEFAVGATNVNPHYGPARNPWNPALSPGGSSGGSGVAVAAGMCPGALGTDTGGSVRVPSALCGLTGLRPALGAVSTQGVVPMSGTLDTVGPMAHTARDIALMLGAMVTEAGQPFVEALGEPVHGLRVGIPTDDLFWAETMIEVAGLVHGAADVLHDLGVALRQVRLEGVEDTLFATGVIGLVDAALYHRERLETHPEMFGEDVRARLQRGKARPALDYAQAMQIMRTWQAALARLFREQIDLLLVPMTPVVSHAISDSEGVAAAAELLRFTYPFSLSGLPALALPCGFSEDGLPVGAQLVSPRAHLLLAAAHAYQSITEWHLRRPALEGDTPPGT